MQRALAYCLSTAAGLSVAAAAPSVDTSKMSLQDYARLPICTLSADGQHLAVEPCRTAPARAPMPRRPVPQMVQRQPPLPPPLDNRRAVPLPPVPKVPSSPSLPMPALNCDAGGCYDLNGVRHNNAAGNSTITPGGKLCIRNGAWLQCP